MKTIKLLFMLIVISMAINANADNGTFERPELKVWLDDVTVVADGVTVSRIHIYENDIVDYTAFNMSINLPRGIQIAKKKVGRDYVLDLEETDRSSADHSYAAGVVNGLDDPTQAMINIGAYSPTIATFYPDDVDSNPLDELVSIGIIADPNMVNGEYYMTVHDIKFIEVDLKNDAYYPSGEVTFKITVTGGKEPNVITFADQANTDADPINLVTKSDDNWLCNEVALIDALPLTVDNDFTATKLTYKRSFAHTNWHALYLPFAMSYTEWSEFGEVAQLTGVAGTAEQPILQWTRINSGTLTPNTPYIFLPNEVGEVVFNSKNVAVTATPDEDGALSYVANGVRYTLAGTYQLKEDMATTGAFALANGVFRPTDSDAKKLNPFRIYLTMRSSSMSIPARVINVVDDVEITGLEDILIENADGTIYDIQGRRVVNPDKGIYIIGNNKTLIK